MFFACTVLTEKGTGNIIKGEKMFGRIRPMDVNTINLILWAPFALIGLLTTLIYVIKGLRKGVKPALASLAAIVLAAVLGIFIARGLAGLITPALQGAISAEVSALSDMMVLLVLSVISTLAAMLLFMLLFLILTPIIAAIGKAILRKKAEPVPVTSGGKAGGAALGLVSALLFSLIFLLPIYGSLAAYAPVVRSALDMIPDASAAQAQEAYSLQPLSAATAKPVNKETRQAPVSDLQLLREILDCILQHPLVELSSTAPVQAVYTSLSEVSVEEAPVNLSDMAATVEKLMEKIAAVTQADDAHRTEACRELVTFCREKVLPQEWAYTVYAMVLDEADDLFDDEPHAEEILDLLTFDAEEFQDNAEAILDFIGAVLEQDALEQLEQGDIAALAASGLLDEAVKLLNATDKMAELKNLVYRIALESVAEGKADQARAFAAKYPLARLTDAAQQKQEAEAFRCLADTENGNPMEFFLRHPSLGQKALQDLMILLGITA